MGVGSSVLGGHTISWQGCDRVSGHRSDWRRACDLEASQGPSCLHRYAVVSRCSPQSADAADVRLYRVWVSTAVTDGSTGQTSDLLGCCAGCRRGCHGEELQ